MRHGAAELNPVMAWFLPNNLLGFALTKLALTGAGLCVLVACSRMRLFRRIPGELVVYAVLGVYVWLVAYELRMLELAASLSS
jgi:MFS superfamily sulfate permease-like transporter